MPNGTLMFGKLTTVRIVRFSCDKKHLPPPIRHLTPPPPPPQPPINHHPSTINYTPINHTPINHKPNKPETHSLHFLQFTDDRILPPSAPAEKNGAHIA